jgi:hypothetical protein
MGHGEYYYLTCFKMRTNDLIFEGKRSLLFIKFSVINDLQHVPGIRKHNKALVSIWSKMLYFLHSNSWTVEAKKGVLVIKGLWQ